MSARVLKVTELEYHADPCEIASLSHSVAHVLTNESPLHAWTIHPKLGAHDKPRKLSTDNGAIIHKLILGKGVDVEVVTGYDDFKTKAAQAIRDEALEAGRIPIVEQKFTALQIAAEAIRSNLAIEGISLRGESEVALEFTEKGARGEVLCRARMDHILFDQGVIYDLKTTDASAHPEKCARRMGDFGADIQSVCYPRALAQYLPERQGRIDFLFLVGEINPPYAVCVARPSGAMRELGEELWLRAVLAWEHCLATNSFPGYGGRVHELEPPPWRMKEKLQNDW